jgi:hypothetical protein
MISVTEMPHWAAIFKSRSSRQSAVSGFFHFMAISLLVQPEEEAYC